VKLLSHGFHISGAGVKPGCSAIALLAQDVRDAHKRRPKRGRVIEAGEKELKDYAPSGKGVRWNVKTGEVWLEVR